MNQKLIQSNCFSLSDFYALIRIIGEGLQNIRIGECYNRYLDYLLVPPDYEPDEEKAAREKEDSHFTISYGSDKVTNEHADFVTFEKDGISYNIMSFDGVSQDDLFTIAEELIK